VVLGGGILEDWPLARLLWRKEPKIHHAAPCSVSTLLLRILTTLLPNEPPVYLNGGCGVEKRHPVAMSECRFFI